MKKFTKFSLIISLLFFIYSCGYTPLYQSESSNFYFSEIKTNTNNLYFNTIKNFLSKYTIDKGQENKYFIEDKVDIVIQINGKKRGLINVEKGINEESITNKAIIEKNIKKYIENKEIIKKIYVKDRLLNLIIK